MEWTTRCWLVLLVLLRPPSGCEDPARNKQEAQQSKEFVFEVKPEVIAAGDTAILRWSIEGATKVLIEESPDSSRGLRRLGTFGATGSLQVQSREGTTYIATCEGSTTYSCASVSIRVRIKHS
jgi:hypothetical protein